MIFIYVVFFTALFVGALVWYACNYGVISVLNSMQTQFPDYYSGGWVTFLRATWHWMLLIVVLMAGLLWIYVNSQRQEVEGYV